MDDSSEQPAESRREPSRICESDHVVSNAPGFSICRVKNPSFFCFAAVESRTWINQRIVRVRLRGPGLVGFQSPGCDDHVRVYFPKKPIKNPDKVTKKKIDKIKKAKDRDYTPVAFDDDWLELDVVAHGPIEKLGVGARWAAECPIGSVVGIEGPRSSRVLRGQPEGWLLAGDETGLPAIRRFISRLSDSARGAVFVETERPGLEVPLSTPAGVHLEHVYRNGSAPGEALSARLALVEPEDRPEGEVMVFVAAEKRVVKPARALALDRWGLSKTQVLIKGYWKLKN